MGKPSKGISVDGGCSGNPGNAYYRGVDIETGVEVFSVRLGEATNNIAEFFAICHALHKYPNYKIYSDSVTAISWIKKGKVKTTFLGNKGVSERLSKAENWLKTIDVSNIEKWDTRNWGEIPADFGLKR